MSEDRQTGHEEKPTSDEGAVRTPPVEEQQDRDPLGGSTLADVEGEIDPSDVE